MLRGTLREQTLSKEIDEKRPKVIISDVVAGVRHPSQNRDKHIHLE